MTREKAVELVNKAREFAEAKIPGSVENQIKCVCTDVDFDKKSLTFEYMTDSFGENVNGVLHGGISAALLDDAMGFCAGFFKQSDYALCTSSLTINYIKAIPIGSKLTIKSWLIHTGSTLHYLEAKIICDDKVCCTATAVFANIVSKKSINK